jgi:sugar O-acyltransferase (sialic acid O-acetyltransferase NeuD family)
LDKKQGNTMIEYFSNPYLDKVLSYTTAQSFRNDTTYRVLGRGGFAKEVNGLLWQMKIKAKETFIDDNTTLPTDDILVIGIGDPASKKKFAEKFKLNYFPNIIAKDAVCDIEMGIGNVICNGNIFTVDISIGNLNAFNLNCTIGHDVRIGNYNQINPSVNISGRVTIGDECLIGAGAIILEQLTICSNVIIGAGAVVTKDITEPGTYIGLPARKI